jgi:hypothetical protein
MSAAAADTGAQAAADAAAAADASAAAAKGDKGKSALASGQEKPETWIPEKYHVRAEGKKDGPIDEAASLRALAKGYTELNKRMIDVGLPPEDAEKYEIEGLPKDFDVAEFRKDPEMANFLKGAHSLGLTNKQVNYVIGQYLKVAPEIAGAAQELSGEECTAQLKLVWKSDAELATAIKSSFNAATKLADVAGLTYDQLDARYGNDPTFIRLMAALAKQMGEDVPPHGSPGSDAAGDFDTQVKALRAELDQIPERNTKERGAVRAKLDALYSKRFGNAQRAPLLTINPGKK